MDRTQSKMGRSRKIKGLFKQPKRSSMRRLDRFLDKVVPWVFWLSLFFLTFWSASYAIKGWREYEIDKWVEIHERVIEQRKELCDG